jgi:hypothetical protein
MRPRWWTMCFMRAVRVALVTVTVLMLAGCTSALSPRVLTSGSYSAVVDVPQSTSGDAAIVGFLVIDKAGCWSLSQKAGGDPQAIVWPSGTNPVGKKLHVPGIREPLTVGTAITGGGGGGPARRRYPPCIARGETTTYVSGIALAP